MQNVTGQVVVGSNFFDRKAEIARFWSGLETDNLLLLAPRRVGKSSVLRHMKESAPHAGFTGVYLDVCDCADELRFVQRLYAAILEHHGSADRLWKGITESWLGKTVRRVKKAGAAGFSIEFEGNDLKWDRMGEELAEALEGLEGRTLIQVDELPVFVLKLQNRSDDTDQSRMREFLYWLRRLRQEYPQVRWMLAGSIGLDTVASRLNIADSINDLRIETPGSLRRGNIARLIAGVGEGLRHGAKGGGSRAHSGAGRLAGSVLSAAHLRKASRLQEAATSRCGRRGGHAAERTP